MYADNKVLAIVPARGGSKGVPRKNLKTLAGKPLIAYGILPALKSKYVDRVVVSTDDKTIASVAKRFGAEVVRRPKRLAHDDSLVIDAVRYTLKQLARQGFDADIVLLLEATSPLRTTHDIDEAIRALDTENADTAATFSESDISPNRLWKIDGSTPRPYLDEANPWLPRQAQPNAYRLNALAYAMRSRSLAQHPASPSILVGNVCAIITEKNRPVIDIDTEHDFIVAEALMKMKQQNERKKTKRSR